MENFDQASGHSLEKRYYPYPNSLDPLTPLYRTGLIPVTLFATMSLLSVTTLLVFITHRLVSWRKHYREYVGYNQYVILIYNLLLADLQQAIAFVMSFHWLRINKILAPTAPCFIQAWFLQIGDVSSGFFVLAIAVHTWLGVVKGYKMPYKWFVVSILCLWGFALLLTVLGPLMYRDRYFGRAGGWCWVSTDYQSERLWLHYLWIFIVEFGTIGIYGHIFIHLRGRIQTIMNNNTTKLTRATKFMVMYPAVYVILTLPIAVGRMVAMTGTAMPDVFFCIAGSLLTSCGWIDALLYTLTRRILVTNEISTAQYNRTVVTMINTNNTGARPGDLEHYGLTSMDKDIPARSVTIVGGSNRLSRMVDGRLGRTQTRKSHMDSVREDSPTGSQDSIIKGSPLGDGITVQVETNIHVSSADDDAVSPMREQSHSALQPHAR
ncbi:G protein-coupled glucose receptor regulating Gpa2-domain-containing protein [Boeremia exigua]|uniref:G protein-coupled glucose receptor regulating Gpa2-domain-containing protein n=1 Tax=Boeremia exigua TaxID=749465 RepID=UPI001E8E2876|nr:G protein-coupled glucose receptor regulating Gpa2-domain-containing protein [Boeremia exigua]KAH6620287.1 G protein-coupled glucose receptor regulating Gpa2-domain-containing protein [Boeremia exigua]